MLDKLLLNNQLLANKKLIEKVKVNLVNKLVQKLRKLKQLNDKYPENNKFKDKLNKAVEIVANVKKTNSIEIQKQALLNDQKPHVVITNGRSTPEEVAQALYFSHKKIVEVVNSLKVLFHLDESDTTWKEQVAELSKRKKKLLRTEKKQKHRQERKVRHELSLKREEWLVENLPAMEPTEEIAQAENDPLSKLALPGIQSKPKKVKKTTKQQPPAAPAAVQVESDNEEVQPTNIRAVDPFFITETGDNYLSTAVIDRVQSEAPNDGLVRKERRAAKNIHPGRRARNTHFRTPYIKNEKAEHKRKNFQSNSLPNEKSPAAGKSRGLLDRNNQSERLHPSWMANQKQKGIHEFQGTKIKFSADSGKTTARKNLENVGDIEKLHPSWAAKQKLKPSIAEFKGKKIIFGDD